MPQNPSADLDRPRVPVPPRQVTTDTPGEFLVVAHLRRWCHDTSACPLCEAYRRAHDAGAALVTRRMRDAIDVMREELDRVREETRVR